MHAGRARRGADYRIAVIRQARDHGVDRLPAQLRAQRLGVGGIQAHGLHVGKPVGARHAGRRGLIDIGELHLVEARFGQQPGDQRADFAGPQNQHPTHAMPPAKCPC